MKGTICYDLLCSHINGDLFTCEDTMSLCKSSPRILLLSTIYNEVNYYSLLRYIHLSNLSFCSEPTMGKNSNRYLVTHSLTHSFIQSVSQSACQSACQPISQSVSHSVCQTASQSVSKSVSQPISQSVSQPVSQSVSQPVSQ